LLRKAKADGTFIDEIEVSYSAATTSLDIDYHKALQRINVCADTISDNARVYRSFDYPWQWV
jgi:hypothetical protein